MSMSIQDLRKATDDELIAIHDRLAKSTIVGTSFYLDELQRRETLRTMRASQRTALAATILSVVSTIAAMLALFLR